MNPETDLTALNTLPPGGASSMAPMDFPDMGDLNANVASAEASRGGYQQSLDTAIEDVPQAPQSTPDTAQEPQRNIQSLMQMSPWLIMLTALGGSRTQLSGNNMLAATTGMINGLNQGDEAGYQQAYQKYQDEHQKWAELQKQKWDVYREMVKVYKDRIDGKQRALQVAEQAVRDARKDRSDSMMAYFQTIRAGVQIKDLNRKMADTESVIADRKAKQLAAQAEHERKTAADATKGAKTGKVAAAKKQEHDKAVGDANTEIDQLIQMLKSDKGTLGLTGLGGRGRRALEAAGNITHTSNDTRAAQFESRLQNLQLKVAPVLASSNRTAKDQREKIEKVVRGMHMGDTTQNTIAALEDLKKEIGATEPDSEAERTVVQRGTYQGRAVVKYSDGTVEYADGH
jgi:hypothetical protein